MGSATAGSACTTGARTAAGANGQVIDEFMSTGAIVCGRGTIEPAGWWGGDHHDGVPIFVLSRREPGSEPWPLVTYVPDIRTAMAEAKRAAGEKDVLVHGAGIAQRRARRGRPGRDRDPPRPGAARPGPPALRRSGARAHRARAHAGPPRRRRDAPALPRAALISQGGCGTARYQGHVPHAAAAGRIPARGEPARVPGVRHPRRQPGLLRLRRVPGVGAHAGVRARSRPPRRPAAYQPPAPADLRASTLLTLRDPARERRPERRGDGRGRARGGGHGAGHRPQPGPDRGHVRPARRRAARRRGGRSRPPPSS